MTATRGGFAALDPCVHCGFCLQACPTFLATGDEADSPRGRIELMRAFERGALDAADVAWHLDRCLGCRGCEPVCPSGVGYGAGLEEARARIAATRGVGALVRTTLATLTEAAPGRVVYALARFVRATGLPRAFAGRGRIGFALGMLAATAPERATNGAGGPPPPAAGRRASLFLGCVMNGLFDHVHRATARTLAVNGWTARAPAGQRCCGALHAHAGLRDEARALARANLAAFGGGDEPVVVNSAGCGAFLREYDHLVPGAEAARFARRVVDVTEILAAAGPARGAPLALRVAYDPPCHLIHAQRVVGPPLAVLRAIPGVTLLDVPDADQCCGSAGLFTLVEPAMSRTVLAAKLARLRAARPDVVATGNPGCLMQIGAGLRGAGVAAEVRHPVELLDRSYRAAGLYA